MFLPLVNPINKLLLKIQAKGIKGKAIAK